MHCSKFVAVRGLSCALFRVCSYKRVVVCIVQSL